MKVSDIMLDLQTGDASVHDAYVQEAMGQINVSAAIYEAAKNIASLDPSEMTEVIQEAATEAGLPTDREQAIELMYEAAQNVLIGTSRHLFQEAAIFVESVEKKTTPARALNAVAKQCGVKEKINLSKEYAKTFAKAICGKNGLDLDNKSFITGASAKKATKALVKGFTFLSQACGNNGAIDRIEKVPAVEDVLGGALPTSKCKGECTVSYYAGNIENAYDSLSTIKESPLEKTDKVNEGDVATCLYCWFATYAVSKALTESMDAALEKKIKVAFKKQDKKKATSDLETIVSKGKDANKMLHDLCTELMTSFGDAFDKILTKKGSED